MSKLKYRYLILLLLLSIPLYFLNIHTTHPWGDDFAQYIKEALNIVNGDVFYKSNYIYNPQNTGYAPPQYPPGYPLLLAPAVKLWGINYTALNYYNTTLLVILLLTIFHYFKGYMREIYALCLSLVCIYSSFVVGFKNNILSDIPSWLFIMLYIVARRQEYISPLRISCLILLLTMAILTRTQSVVLLAAEGLFSFIYCYRSIIHKKKIQYWIHKPSAIIIVGTILLFVFINSIIFPTPHSTIQFYSQLSASVSSLKATIADNANHLLRFLIGLIHFNPDYTLLHAIINTISYCCIAFALLGFIYTIQQKQGIDDLYFILLIFMILVLVKNQDMRFIISLLPIYLLYCYQSARILLPKIFNIKPQKLAIILTCFYLLIGFDEYKKALLHELPGGVPLDNDMLAFERIKQLVPNEDIIAFSKPRLLTLYTDKKSLAMGYNLSLEDNKKVLDSFNTRYLLVRYGVEDGFYTEYIRKFSFVDSATIAPAYVLYKLK